VVPMRCDGGGGGVGAITRAGAHVARERSPAPGFAALDRASSAGHGRAVSWIAAAAEIRGFEWFGPADLRSRVSRDDGARHVPDMDYVHAGGPTAIEVEPHKTPRPRVRAILRGYRDPSASASSTR
jgi:hypothetical protein